jgi:hypothetical protein
MCLLFAIFVLLGPRALIFFWWLLEPARWAATFETAIIPMMGFLFLPWTTIMWVLVFPGGVDGLDWLWLGIGLAVDIASYTGSTWSNRDKASYTTYDGV